MVEFDFSTTEHLAAPPLLDQDVYFDPQDHRTLSETVPGWLYKTLAVGAATGTLLLVAACDPDGYNRDSQGNCIEQNTRRQEACLKANETRKPHLSSFGKEIDRQTAEGYDWAVFEYNGTNWNLFKDGADYNKLKDSIGDLAVSSGDSTSRDKAAVACTLSSIIFDARNKNLPVSPIALDVPEQIVEMIRGGAMTPSQLLARGIDKFREGVAGKEDANSGHFSEAAAFCSFAGEWIFVGQPTYDTNPNSAVMKACGDVCKAKDLFPVPAGVRGSAK